MIECINVVSQVYGHEKGRWALLLLHVIKVKLKLFACNCSWLGNLVKHFICRQIMNFLLQPANSRKIHNWACCITKRRQFPWVWNMSGLVPASTFKLLSYKLFTMTANSRRHSKHKNSHKNIENLTSFSFSTWTFYNETLKWNRIELLRRLFVIRQSIRES